MAAPSPDALLHLATLHLLSQAGFASTSRAASLTLSSVVGEYFKLVARASVDRAVLAGRSKPGAYDVVESLEELGYGFRLDDLYSYGLDSGRDAFEGEGLGRLADYLEEGLGFDDSIAELKVVPTDEIKQEEDDDDDEDDNEEEQDVKDEPMDSEGDITMDEEEIPPKTELQSPPTTLVRFPSPDYSWLPPLPDPLATSRPDPSSPTAAKRQPERAVEATSAPASIFERYKTRILFTSSSIASQAHYLDPPTSSSSDTDLPPSTSSLGHLISTYAETKGELTTNIRQNGYRLQALDLLRRQIAPPDAYAPSDSLSIQGCVSGPRVTPITVPPHPVPVNPEQSGILSRLVHSIHSPNLPPELRERLTSVRPPLAQKKDGQPLYYGPGLRGADEAALMRAQGKEPEQQEEVLSYATWDSGPRGIEKFSRGSLPRGKKVIKYVEGEDVPRQEKRPAGDAAPARTLRIKLGDSVSPAPPASGAGAGAEAGGQFLSPPIPTPSGPTLRISLSPVPPPNGPTGPTPTPPIVTPGGTTLKLKIKRDSQDVSTPGPGGPQSGPLPVSARSASPPRIGGDGLPELSMHERSAWLASSVAPLDHGLPPPRTRTPTINEANDHVDAQNNAQAADVDQSESEPQQGQQPTPAVEGPNASGDGYPTSSHDGTGTKEEKMSE